MAHPPTGYGPLAQTAQNAATQAIPIFDGKREDFAAFKFKCRLVFLELDVIDVLEKPNYGELYESVKQRVERLSQLRGEEPARAAELAAARAELEKMERSRRLIARVLHTRVSERVCAHMRKVLPEAQHFEPVALWQHLLTYDQAEATRRAAENFELQTLSLLRMSCHKDQPLSKFVRIMHQRLQPLLQDPKIVGSVTGKRLVCALVLRHIVDSIGDGPGQRYRPLRERYLQLLIRRRRGAHRG